MSIAELSAPTEIWQVIRGLYFAPNVGRAGFDRRQERRYAFPFPFRITPIDSEQQLVTAESQVVIGKSFSEQGVDFYHYQPLPYRNVVASFEPSVEPGLELVLELHWCRFGQHRIYDSGGKFLRAYQPPTSYQSEVTLFD